MKRYVAFLLAALVVSCGGGDDGGSASAGGSTSGGGTTTGGGTTGGGTTGGGTTGGGTTGGGIPANSGAANTRIEETDVAVSLSAGWAPAGSGWGWSGGSAVKSDVAGSTATLTFSGTAVRWLGQHGRGMGKALVRIDGGPAKEVNMITNVGDIIRTPIITIYDLSDGPHTLTIEVESGLVVIDAFDIQPTTTISHWQDTDPNAKYSAGWTKSATNQPWSGNGAQNLPELPVTAHETNTADETVTIPFRGTGINWVGYKGPDGGIATVQIDGGAPVEVDTYSPTTKYQAIVFSDSGLADTNHTLTIKATGRKNDASSAPRVVVDAFDVITPGRRFENSDPAVAYSGNVWNRNHIARVWSNGSAATSNVNGSTATFSFSGTSVSWIGCRKSSAGGTAKVFIDGVLMKEITLRESYPIEGYQMTVFRQDGLANGPHTMVVQVSSATDGPYVVVDAFDIHP